MAARTVSKTPVTMVWPTELHEELRRLAYERHEPMTRMTLAAVREWLDRQPENNDMKENTTDAAAAPERRAA
jgi:hypothetical protein